MFAQRNISTATKSIFNELHYRRVDFKMVNLTTYNISIVLLVCLGAYTYGFSFAVFGTSIGEPGFYLYFALDREFSPYRQVWHDYPLG